MNKQQKWIRLSTILFLILLSVLILFLLKAYFNGQFHSVESMRIYIEQFGQFGPIILTMIQAIQVIIPILPGFFGCVVGSALFGVTTGFLCNYIGIALGSIGAFFLARQFGKPLLHTLFPSNKYNRWSTKLSQSKSYTLFLFMAMLLPLFPDDYLCYLTGVSKMKTNRFIWIVLLGKPWCIFAYCLGFSLLL